MPLAHQRHLGSSRKMKIRQRLPGAFRRSNHIAGGIFGDEGGCIRRRHFARRDNDIIEARIPRVALIKKHAGPRGAIRFALLNQFGGFLIRHPLLPRRRLNSII